MAKNERELSIVISAQDRASSKIAALGSKIESSFSKVSLAAGVALAGVGAFAMKAIGDFVEAERSTRQLEHAVIDVSKGTREQADAILEVTDALQKKAGIDGDALTMGAAQLSTFGLQTDSVLKLTKTMADLTVNQAGITAGADDYVSSANVMAKALKGQFSQLEKSGIRFTEAQQRMLQFGTETEKVAALTEGLNQNLRETTDTIGNTAEAQFAKLHQSLGDISEAVGAALLPALNAIVEKIIPIVQGFTAWAQANPQLIAAIVAATIAVTGFLAAIGPLGTAIALVGAAIEAWPLALFVSVIVGAGVAAVMFRDKLAELYTVLQNTGAIDKLIAIWEMLKAKLQELWVEFQKTGIIQAFQNALMLVADAVIANLWPALQELWLALQPWLPLLESLAKLFGIILVGALLALLVALATLINIMGAVTLTLLKLATAFSNALKPAIDTTKATVDSITSSIMSLVTWFNNAIDAITRFIAKAREISGGVAGNILSSIGLSGKRATGGPVGAGKTYLVGEHGPEYFTPYSGGTVSTAAPGGGAGNIGVNVNVSVGQVTNDVEISRLADAVGDAILQRLQSNMSI